MSASINHELNQPLTAIRSYADNGHLLLDRERYGDVRGNLRKIAEMVDRMATIGAQLKQFARKTTGHCISVSLVDSVAASIGILGSKLKNVGVEVENRIPRDSSLNVQADPIQLEQILINLISNAANAVKEQSERRIEVSAETVGNRVVVRVSDNGPGIPEDRLEQIFEPFFTTRETGLGLGLSISQRIAQSMGGTLNARNSIDGGAVFSLELCAASDQQDAPETGTAA